MLSSFHRHIEPYVHVHIAHGWSLLAAFGQARHASLDTTIHRCSLQLSLTDMVLLWSLQRLSLDANMLRGQGEFGFQQPGARYGGTARHSDTVNYAGGALGHAPSSEYIMSVSYGAGADMQAQPDGGGDQLGPLPTQVSAGVQISQTVWIL